MAQYNQKALKELIQYTTNHLTPTMSVINTDKYVMRQFHSNTSLWLVEIWRMSAPSSYLLIQACDWLK